MHPYVMISEAIRARANDSAAQPQHDSRGPVLYWVMLVFLILAGIFVTLRAYVKIFLVKKLSPEDWFMFAAYAVYMAYGIIALDGITYGSTGKHVSDMTLEQAIRSLRDWWLCEVLYGPITILCRTSICLLLLRIATDKVHRIVIWVNLALISSLSIALEVVMFNQCSPPSYFWEQFSGAKGFCRDINMVPNATIVQSVLSAIADWCLALLPIALLWNVQLSFRTKATVAALLSMGVFAGVALIVRIPFLRRLAISPDFLYETIDVAVWSVLEPSLGIMAGCIATLRPLFKQLGCTGWGSTRRSYGRSGGRSDKQGDYSASGGGSSGGVRGSRVFRSKPRSRAMDEEWNGSGVELNGYSAQASYGDGEESPDYLKTREMLYREAAINVQTSISVQEEISTPPAAVRPWAPRGQVLGNDGDRWVGRPPSMGHS